MKTKEKQAEPLQSSNVGSGMFSNLPDDVLAPDARV